LRASNYHIEADRRTSAPVRKEKALKGSFDWLSACSSVCSSQILPWGSLPAGGRLVYLAWLPYADVYFLPFSFAYFFLSVVGVFGLLIVHSFQRKKANGVAK
jgi:hypothetical protein